MIPCIHGRPAADPLAGVDPAHVVCLDCEELAALRQCEDWLRSGPEAERPFARRLFATLDGIRRRKGIGALGHPETRDLEGR